jgi:hypothetical protein
MIIGAFDHLIKNAASQALHLVVLSTHNEADGSEFFGERMYQNQPCWKATQRMLPSAPEHAFSAFEVVGQRDVLEERISGVAESVAQQ